MRSQALEFRILGPVEAVRGGRLLSLEPRQRSLLALLLLKANQVVSRHELLEQLWPDVAEPKASHSLDVHLSKLRRALGADKSRLTRRSGGYVLHVEPNELDLERFEQLAARGRRRLEERRPADARAELRAALELWRGEPLQGIILDQPGLAVGLDERRLSVLEDRIDSDLALGRHAELISELQKLTSLYPLRERLRAQLMLCLYRSGRQSDALELYRHTRELYVSELGIEPGREMQELQKGILRQDPSLEALSAARRALPVPLTSFVDRAVELGELRTLVTRRDVRLVTLTGTGGVGKTRLALEAAAGLAGDYPDGVFLVELAPLSDPDLLLDTIGNVLGAREGAAAQIGERRLLLLLDNFEHLLDGAAEVTGLLRSCANLSVLTTSRERLRLSGEHVFEVPPLPDEEAVVLFTERARAIRRGVRLDAEVKTICSRLDGIPLAIELAAARVADIPPETLLEQLQQRLGALNEGPRDLPARQQTLRAAIEWSYNLLTEEERALFARLSVFVGGCTLEAAEDVAGADPHALQELVDKSLVRRIDERFWMLETIREYALERLSAGRTERELRRRHADFFVRLAEGAQADLNGPAQGVWMDRFEREHDNLREALYWSRSTDKDELLARLAVALWRFWHRRGHLAEGRHWLEEATLRSDGLAAELRVRLRIGRGYAAIEQGDLETAWEVLEEAVGLARESGDQTLLADALNSQGLAAHDSGRLEAAEVLHEESLAIRRELGEPGRVAASLNNLANVARSRNESARARTYLEEALAIFRETGDNRGVGVTCAGLGNIVFGQGNLGRARLLLRESLSVVSGLGDTLLVAWDLSKLAELAEAEGRHQFAARLQGAAAALEESLGRVSESSVSLRSLEAQAWAEGHAMTLEEAVALALEIEPAGVGP
jgi:predicted ATPase/DNA-binding SARP family transcriptional activator